MSEVIDRGILSITADVSGLEASMLKAKRSLRDFGQTTGKEQERNRRSIDKYVEGLQTQAVTFGKSARESELFRLKLRGATDEQLKAADAALRLTERQEKAAATTAKLGSIAKAAGVLIATAFIAAAHAARELIKQGADFQDVAEKMGDSASNIASIAPAAAVAGIELNDVADATIHLNKNLGQTGDDALKVQHALAALGLKMADLQKLTPTEQLEAVGRALNKFADGPAKAQIATDLFNKSGKNMLVVLKELGNEGSRTTILSDEQIQRLDDFMDRTTRAGAVHKQQFIAVLADGLPTVEAYFKTISDFAKSDTMKSVGESFKTLGGIIADLAGTQLRNHIEGVAALAFVYNRLKLGVVGVNIALDTLRREGPQAAKAVLDRMSSDMDKSEQEYHQFVRRIRDMGQPVENPSDPSYIAKDAIRFGRKTTPADEKKPKLSYTPYNAGAANKAKAEREAALKLEIERIHSDAETTASAFEGAERIIEARRAAALMDEREYYDAKVGLLKLGSQASELALQAEVAAIERYVEANKKTLDKKDLLEKAKELEDLRGKLAKLQAKNATDAEVSAIQQAAALKRVEDAYQDAAIAAKNYLDTIARQSRVEVDGIGKGDKARQQANDLAQIRERFESEKARLEQTRRSAGDTPQAETDFRRYLALASETYNKEVALYLDRTARIEAKEADWVNGFTDAWANYIDNARNAAKQSEDLFSNAFKGLEDTLTEFITKGKADFKGLLNSIATEIVRMGVRQTLGDIFKGLGKSDFGSSIAKLFGRGDAAPATAVANTAQQSFRLSEIAAQNASSATGVAGAATDAAAGASLAATLTTAGASLAAELTTAGASIAAEMTAAGASLSAELITAGATLTGEIAAAGATFAAEVTAAGAAFAATVATAAAASAAGSSASTFTTAAMAVAGGRAVGGPVSAGGVYQVNERGPELLSVAGREYLMVGSQGGEVKPFAGGAPSASPTNVYLTVAPPPNSSRQTAMQWGAEAGRHLQHAMRRQGK